MMERVSEKPDHEYAPVEGVNGADSVSVLNDPLFSHVLGDSYLYNPYPVLASLREKYPAFQSRLGPLVVTKHHHVSAALKHPMLISDPRGSEMYKKYLGAHYGHDFGKQALSHMQFKDGTEHLRVRRAFASYLNVTDRRKCLHSWVWDAANSLADELWSIDGIVDFMPAYARRLPGLVMSRMLDLPSQDAELLAQFAEALVAADDPEFLVHESKQRMTVHASNQAARYFGRMLVQRQKNMGDDLLSHLLMCLEQGELTSLEELIVNLLFFLVAGLKTTTDFLGNAVHALGHNPDVWAQASAGHTSVAGLVEECLRYDSPIQQTPRFATHSFELEGVRVEAGAHVMLMLGAANRDPAVFDDPDVLHVNRASIREHVAFGGGAHHCLGSMFARQETQMALEVLLERFSAFSCEPGCQRFQSFTLRGFQRLPLRFKRS